MRGFGTAVGLLLAAAVGARVAPTAADGRLARARAAGPTDPVQAAGQTPGASSASGAESRPLPLRPGDRVVLLGNTLAERQQHFNHFETLLMTRFPELQLVVRNLGWSGDTLTLQPRPLNFGDTAFHLAEQRADVIVAFFGANESFDGEEGLGRFRSDLDAYLKAHLSATYNGRTPPRLALVSPIAHERLPRLVHVDVDARNRELARYTDAMREVSARNGVTFVDVFTPTNAVMAGGPPLTINGIHVNEAGDRILASLLMEGLGFDSRATREATSSQIKELEALRERIRLKNEEFFRRWRPLNAEYVVGRRVEPFGSVSFPPEMRALDRRVEDMDGQIWRRARALRGVRYPSQRQSGHPEAAAPPGVARGQE